MRKYSPIINYRKHTLIYELNILEDGTFIKILVTGGVEEFMSVHENE